MFKITNKKTRRTSLTLFLCLYFELWTYFTHSSGVSLVDIEQVNTGWVMNLITEKQSRPKVFCKEGVLINFVKFTGKHLCQSFFFNKVAGWGLQIYLKGTLAHVFSCEFCEIYKNTFSYRKPLVAASAHKYIYNSCLHIIQLSFK